MVSNEETYRHCPLHIRNLISDLAAGGEVISTLSPYIPILSSDISLYYIFLHFNYSPEHGNFLSPPSPTEILSCIKKEYHSSLPEIEESSSKLVIDIKKEFLFTFQTHNLHTLADPSDLDLIESRSQRAETETISQPQPKFSLTSDMNTPRVNKGLKVLSKKIKDFLIQKGRISYKEMSDMVVTDLEKEIDRDKEERNVLRRIYDGLNVLEACGVVGKSEKKYFWKGYSKPRADVKESLLDKVVEMKTTVETKREILREYCKRFYSAKELIMRNKMSCGEEEKIEFPFIVVGTEEHHLNKVRIESNKSRSDISIRFQREIRLFGDSDILIQMGLYKRPMHSADIPVDLFESLACKTISKLY